VINFRKQRNRLLNASLSHIIH